MATPLAVRWEGSRTPTSVTSVGWPRRALLEQVDDVTAVEGGEVGVAAALVGQAADRGAGHAGQRCLALVGGAELVGGGTKPVAALLDVVRHIAA